MSTHNDVPSPPSASATALVAGGGLVGSLCAAMLAQRGWTVTLVESRADPRRQKSKGGARARSINLALSARGIEALRSVSDRLAERVLKEGLPMRGRMIHKKRNKGKGQSQAAGSVDDGQVAQSKDDQVAQDYGFVEEGEVINSISRGELGNYLLDYVEEEFSGRQGGGSVKIAFETKLLEMDLRGPEGQGVSVTLGNRDSGEEKQRYDLVIGGDGAYSRVRREMMRGSQTRFNYRQHYAPHAYLELSILPGPNSSWSLEPNYLHIWPRGEFMLIALPNQDKSFTLTLFAHQSTFDSLDAQLSENNNSATENPVVALFRREFPDALKLMGEEALMQSWTENPKDGLITVECSPYHYKDRALLIGDSAHAMVPFYGQGMNCGFEDVRVLSSLLDHFSASPNPRAQPSPLPYSSTAEPLPAKLASTSSFSDRLSLALETYTTRRAPSLKAIQSLAAANYNEMASSVLDPLYLIRLSLDTILSSFFRAIGSTSARDQGKPDDGRGGVWESLYRMTTFRWGLAYEEVLARREWQKRVLERTMAVVVGGTVSILGTAVWFELRGPGREISVPKLSQLLPGWFA